MNNSMLWLLHDLNDVTESDCEDLNHNDALQIALACESLICKVARAQLGINLADAGADAKPRALQS